MFETIIDTNIPSLQTFAANPKFSSSPMKEAKTNQGAIYLPIMKAFLRVMKTDQPSTPEVNSLMVQIRDLSQNVPEEQNLLKSFFAKLGLNNFQDMGLLASGPILVDINGVRSVV